MLTWKNLLREKLDTLIEPLAFGKRFGAEKQQLILAFPDFIFFLRGTLMCNKADGKSLCGVTSDLVVQHSKNFFHIYNYLQWEVLQRHPFPTQIQTELSLVRALKDRSQGF